MGLELTLNEERERESMYVRVCKRGKEIGVCCCETIAC